MTADGITGIGKRADNPFMPITAYAAHKKSPRGCPYPIPPPPLRHQRRQNLQSSLHILPPDRHLQSINMRPQLRLRHRALMGPINQRVLCGLRFRINQELTIDLQGLLSPGVALEPAGDAHAGASDPRTKQIGIGWHGIATQEFLDLDRAQRIDASAAAGDVVHRGHLQQGESQLLQIGGNATPATTTQRMNRQQHLIDLRGPLAQQRRRLDRHAVDVAAPQIATRVSAWCGLFCRLSSTSRSAKRSAPHR